MFDNPSWDQHERVLQLHDAASGLRAIIAIHSTALGPAAGGCRLWTYTDSNAALTDALRLSRGMSFKNALAGLPLGGGKAVILGPVPETQREQAMDAFGRAVESLGGLYITAEDVGISVDDMQTVATRTGYVSGLKAGAGGAGGDPSPYTARGVCRGIEAVAQHVFGRTDLAGLRIAVQGLGHVGAHLCHELAEQGARLTVADIDDQRVQMICDQYGAAPASINDVLLSDVDIVAPCALGGIITGDIASRLKARAIAGAANNQLADAAIGQMLFDRSIAYVPDYLINAGGIIAVASEYAGTADQKTVLAQVDAIHDRTAQILSQSRESATPTDQLADQWARGIIGRGAAQA